MRLSTILSVAAIGACMAGSFNIQESLEIPGEQSPRQKAAFARSYVNQDLYDAMRVEARKRFPQLSDRDSRRLYLRWKEVRSRSGQIASAQIIVGMVTKGDAAESERIVAACARFVSGRMRAALGRDDGVPLSAAR